MSYSIKIKEEPCKSLPVGVVRRRPFQAGEVVSAIARLLGLDEAPAEVFFVLHPDGRQATVLQQPIRFLPTTQIRPSTCRRPLFAQCWRLRRHRAPLVVLHVDGAARQKVHQHGRRPYPPARVRSHSPLLGL